jgi:hypothetical protein
VFLLDSSYLIGQSNWNQMLNFTASIAQRLTIGSTANQVGLVKFGSSASRIFDLNTYASTSQVVNAILSGGYTPDWNDEQAGIDYVASTSFTTARGARPNPIPRVMLVLSAFAHQVPPPDNTNPVTAANNAKAQGIEILSVGVGSGVSTSDVVGISSSPQANGDTYWLVPSFNQLYDYVSQIFNQICPVTISLPTGNFTTFLTVFRSQ